MLILILYFAYVGQAWNIMMGFAGQLSLGHALYAGLGGYIAAGLYFHYGIGPWAGVFAGVAAAVAAAAIVGYLGFRFSLAGVYFALLTIAFAEFTRIGFDNWPWTGGSGGLFLRVERGVTDLANLRGGPVLFYYVILALAVGAFVLCRLLLESRLGRYWLAIREDAEAAQAVGVPVLKCKMLAVTISAAPDRAGRRVERLLLQQPLPRDGVRHGPLDRDDPGADHRRAGHAVRPVRRRRRADRLGRDLHRPSASDLDIPGIKQIFYGFALLVIVHVPAGRRLAVAAPARLSDRMSGARARARRSRQGLPRPARGARRQLHRAGRRDPRADRAQRRGQDHDLQHDRRRASCPTAGSVSLDGRTISGLRPDKVCDAGVGRTFQIVRPFKGLSVLENVTIGALHRRPRSQPRRATRAEAILQRLGLADRRHQPAESLTLPDRKRLEVARALATEPKLLLLDEVMAGLRPTEVDVMVAFLRELNAETGLTILLIEHVMRAVMALAAHVVVVSYGEKIAEGTPAEITRHQAVLDVYLGEEEVA